MALFLLALLALFVTSPFIDKLPNGRYVDAGLVSGMLVAALLVISVRPRRLIWGIMLAAPVFVGHWIIDLRRADGSAIFHLAFYLVFVGFVIFNVLGFILRSPKVDSEVLCAGIATYLLLALLWATAYTLVARLDPGAFSGVPAGRNPLYGFDALYFSAGALTTGGFGDISPVSDPARMLGIMEAITGTLYLAVLISRLVSLYCSPSPADGTNEQSKP